MPGRAQARGKIERLQATLWKNAARELVTYNGRDMDREARHRLRKMVALDLRERGNSRLLLSWEDFLAFCEEKVAAYNNRPHRSLPKIRDAETGKVRHMSPAEALAHARAEGWEPETLPAEVMADLWRPYEVRTTSRGEVRLPWGTYFHEALVPFGGDQVRVGYDIADGSRAWVRTLDDDRLICIALRDGNVIPEQPASKIEHARQRRAVGRLKLLDKHKADVIAESGPALIEQSAEMPLSPAVARHQAEIEAELLAPGTTQKETARVFDIDGPNGSYARCRRALDIEARIGSGASVDADEADWHRIYSQTPEYRALRAMYEDFGEAALEA
jgi:putative transposase